SLGNNTRAVWFRISGVILILLIFQAGGFRRYEFIPSEAMRIAGLILMMLGFAFAIWARIHLGRNWGMPMSRKQEPELVTSGPYALVRHPIYSGILLAVLGTALAEGLFLSIFFIFLFIYFLYSAKKEEKIMTELFPGQYPAYKRRTTMLIPFIL